MKDRSGYWGLLFRRHSCTDFSRLPSAGYKRPKWLQASRSRRAWPAGMRFLDDLTRSFFPEHGCFLPQSNIPFFLPWRKPTEGHSDSRAIADLMRVPCLSFLAMSIGKTQCPKRIDLFTFCFSWFGYVGNHPLLHNPQLPKANRPFHLLVLVWFPFFVFWSQEVAAAFISR